MERFTVHGGTNTASLPHVEVEAESESDAIAFALRRWKELRDSGALALDGWERLFVGTPTIRL